MIRFFFLAVITCLACGTQAATGDRLYVSERLYLSMSAEPLADSPRVRLLESGDGIVEVSRQGDYIQVRVADGTTGWVREAYVTATIPGNVRVASLQQEIAQLQARIVELETPTSDEPEIAIENPEIETDNQRLRDRVTVLETELQQAQKPAPVTEQIPEESLDPMILRWIIAAAVGLFLLGGLFGFSWRSRQVRRRLHGLDI